MARLQDFQTVTPSGSDKLLIVQSQGQGLATLDNVVGEKMDKSNPTGTGSLSIGRKANTTTGVNSSAVGLNCTASGQRSHAEGSETTASGNYGAHSEGGTTTASGDHSHAEGYTSTASGLISHAEGQGTIANHLCQHVFGSFNVADTSTAAATTRGNYVEIVGKGTADNARSNARTLDWSGNEVLAGGLKINGTTDVGEKLPKVNSKTTKSFSATTTMSYTGKSISCPSGKRYLVRAYFRFINTQPLEVVVSTTDQNVNIYNVIAKSQESSCLTFVIDGGETFYYWARYASAGTNQIDEIITEFA